MKNRAIFGSAILLMLTSCGVADLPVSRAGRITPSIEHTIDRKPLSGPLAELDELSPWCNGWVSRYETEQLAQLESIARSAANFSLDEVRAALVQAEEAGYHKDPITSSKMYVLMRLLFKVPDTAPYSEVPYATSGFFRPMTVKGEPGHYPVGWPVRWSGDSLVAVEQCRGSKSASIVYHMVREFDAFRERFPRRDWN